MLRNLDAQPASWTWTWDGRVTATIGCRSKVNELLCVERGDTTNRCFGLAVDVGTTTVVAHLVDLELGNHVRGSRQVQLANSLRRGRGQPHQLRPPARWRRGYAPRRGWRHRRIDR